ncbi:MAG: rhamnulokinase [Oscillospiraceae bacterium]|nr:rhamnulokinase [Oscillospiraceae bacterium]
MEKRVLAFDFGASSGRAILGIFDGETIRLEEIHRFENTPVKMCGTLYWDLPRLFHEVKHGLIKAEKSGGFESLAIDTWGVDFGLIGRDGHLLELPVNYRDSRTIGMLEEAFKRIDKEQFYNATGNQFMEINTAFQLLSLKMHRPDLLDNAETLLLMPDLFDYLLTEKKRADLSIASTTQMFNPMKRNWSEEVLHALGLPKNILPEITMPASVLGTISEEICNELDINPAKVISVCGHDTQCAAAAAPTEVDDFIFISCGTWSLFGTETDKPIINEKSAAFNITNEMGYGGKITFLKNIIGLWLIQESRRQFRREGNDYSFADLEKMALECEPFRCFIDPDAPEFVPIGNIPERVREYCRKTNQYVPESVGEVMRCIYESLALKYRISFDEIKECTGKSYGKIHLVGGGAKDGMLCRMTANACNCEVIAGPIEATAYGNIALQLIADEAIPDIKTARSIIAKSDCVKHYSPETTEEWEDAYKKYLSVINKAAD